ILERSTGAKMIIGDLNARVGRKDHTTADVIGIQGENKRNDNGRRLIDYCIGDDLIIANTFHEHKEIHKIAREVRSRGEKSIIDYIIMERGSRKLIKDTNITRSAEIFSDHYLLTAKVEEGMEEI